MSAVLIFVEDPGAANCVALLPAALKKAGIESELAAGGRAAEYLAQRGVAFREILSREAAVALLEQLTPKLLLVGTSENPDCWMFSLIQAARKQGIVTLGIIDAFVNASLRFCGRTQDNLAYAPDWLAVPDESTFQAFVGLGYPTGRIAICGHPHYDYIRTVTRQMDAVGKQVIRQSVLPEAPAEVPVIVFAAEVSAGLDMEQFLRSSEYTLQGWGNKDGRTHVVLEEFLSAVKKILPSSYLVLRFHPANLPDEFDDYREYFQCFSRTGSSLELLYAADVVVGMTSMILLEAALMGRKTLAILPRSAEIEWQPAIGAGVIPSATTPIAIETMLLKIVQADVGCEAEMLDRTFPENATARVVAWIQKLL